MSEPREPEFEWVGDFNNLTPEFYQALAQVLLAAHDAEKARQQAGDSTKARKRTGDSKKATEQ